MRIDAKNVDEYMSKLPDERKKAVTELRKTILKNLPKGFSEELGYGIPSYVVPLSTYPDGYHCNPKLPLPFLSFASQKNFVALYHMGIYADKKVLDWFTEQYPKHSKTKLDMGKGCIRFKKPDEIPFTLIGELVSKITLKDWVSLYEKGIKK